MPTDQSSSGEVRAPARLRRRLTGAFVAVAAVSAGTVAVLAILITDEYRWRSFRERSFDEARVALALAPSDLDADGFQRLRAQYEARSEADFVAVSPEGEFASSTALHLEDVPTELRQVAEGVLRSEEAEVGDRHYLVIGALAESGDSYWFFFSIDQLRSSLSQLNRASLAAFGVTVVLAGAVGRLLAIRTLRPVAAAAEAAEAIRSGRRDTRLPEGPDEFGAWAGAFNRMADTLEELIEKLQRAAARERRFTADVAHELRTPLTGMAASTAVLEELVPDLPVEARRPVEVVCSDVRRLRTLVLELLELSRLDAVADPVHAERLDLRQAVTTALQRLSEAAPSDVTLDIDRDLSVSAEPARLNRVLANLLINAAEHGDGPVVVRACRDGEQVVVDVLDHGPGITPDELPHVFDRFAKTDRSRGTGGSGLGLAIAKAQAEAQGGSLTAGNEPGGGARLTLRLPSGGPAEGGTRGHEPGS